VCEAPGLIVHRARKETLSSRPQPPPSRILRDRKQDTGTQGKMAESHMADRFHVALVVQGLLCPNMPGPGETPALHTQAVSTGGDPIRDRG
jgi:hypothetical protein